ncbi:hypothetical protein PAECIP111802_03240 [Paenibacillus allorhizosphaerae]|uniref:Uncharacterized protein n=1 Tax=Paenibacillus allorhizosphaerae TaxID=2849866 RepID=A0ABN7TKT7_9BACL|nr:hypothetical protein PAECIP111802_03240 [Paenibacillus allorhizosphaerae]
MSKELGMTTTRRVHANTQRRIRRLARMLVGKVVIVRTLFGTFTGCLLSVGPNTVRLRIFSGIGRTFITIRIPIGIIIDIFRFRCP